jgi:hypothetical protein
MGKHLQQCSSMGYLTYTIVRTQTYRYSVETDKDKTGVGVV